MADRLQLVARLSALALRPLLGDGADNLVKSVFSHLTDSSNKVSVALEKAQGRAWRSLEIALAGPSLKSRIQSLIVSAEERAFRKQVETFLAAAPFDDLPAPADDFRTKALNELQRAKRSGMLPGERLPPGDVPAQAQVFARYTNPQDLLHAEIAAVHAIAESLHKNGFPHLSRFVELRPVHGLPLLVIATRYFFRREVETDEELSRGLTYHQLDRLTQEQENGFAEIHAALDQNAERLDYFLNEIKEAVLETRDDVRAARDDLAEMRAQLAEQGRQMRLLMEQLQAALSRPVAAPASPTNPNPVPSVPAPMPISANAAPSLDPSRDAVERMIQHVRELPAEQQQAATVAPILKQLEQAAQNYDRERKKLFPFLSGQSAPASNPPPMPAGGKSPIIATPSGPAPSLKQVRGPVINESLFISPEAETPPAETAPVPPKSGGRVISPLFQKKTNDS